MRRLSLLLLLSAASLRAAPRESLEDVLARAREYNPEVRAARGAWAAAEGRVGPAGAWPQPLLGWSREKIPGAADTMTHLKAEQDIPFPGKPSAEAVMARHEALLLEARYLAKSLEAAAEARDAYHRLFRSDSLADRLADGVRAMAAALKSAEARVAAGAAPADEALSLRAELGRMENMLWEEKQARTVAAVDLNALLDLPVDHPWGAASAPVLKEPALDLASALRRAEAQSPLYLAAVHEENHAAAMLGRARREALPDFTVMYDRQRGAGGMTGYEAGVGVRAPLWWARPRGSLREARGHQEEAVSSAEAMRNGVRRAVAVEYTEVVTGAGTVRRYEADILPAARGAFRLAVRRYESGRGDFTRMMDAWRSWLTAEREYTEELTEASRHWGLLESAVGAPLEEKP